VLGLRVDDLIGGFEPLCIVATNAFAFCMFVPFLEMSFVVQAPIEIQWEVE
jgi:hypothetical protein